MICEPKIDVVCDKCGYSEEFQMTSLARGAYDLRNLNSDLRTNGWEGRNEDDHHTCASCLETGGAA